METEEEFLLSINASSLPDGVTVGSGANTTVVIVDNNGNIAYNISFMQLNTCVLLAHFLAITINFSQSNYSVKENDGLVQLMLVLSNPSSSNITIRIDTIDREATGETFKYQKKSPLICCVGMDQDYFSGPYFIVFPAGTIESMFNILIMDDDLLEKTEAFDVIINSSSLPSNITISERGEAAVIIWDNDGES